jgi:glycerol-3-phosphate dehydrogenase subunit B
MGAEVVGARTAGGRLEAVRVLAGGRETEHAAGEVVLATGGFASGGLDLDSRWQARERALGLPVHGAPGPGDQRFRPSYFDDHPMSRAGVAVDDELRPVDAAGDVLLQNVRVAGATLAGAVPWREKSGDGISLASGWRAAELVLGATGRTASGRAPSPAPTTAS